MYFAGVGTSKSPASRGGDVLDRVELARLLESELGAFSPKSSAYFHACLSAEHGEEITLGEFVKATRECAKITAAAERHLPWDVDEPRGETRRRRRIFHPREKRRFFDAGEARGEIADADGRFAGATEG